MSIFLSCDQWHSLENICHSFLMLHCKRMPCECKYSSMKNKQMTYNVHVFVTCNLLSLSGGFAFVYVAQDINSGKDYALKVRESLNATVFKRRKRFQIPLVLLSKYMVQLYMYLESEILSLSDWHLTPSTSYIETDCIYDTILKSIR